MEKKASQNLLELNFRQIKEMNDFLLTTEANVNDTDFARLRVIIGSIIAEILHNSVNPILKEIPELTPKEMKDSEFKLTALHAKLHGEMQNSAKARKMRAPKK